MGHHAFSGLSRAVVLIAVSGLGAACSSDVARFDDNPFRTSQVASAPAPAPVVESAPVAQVESQPLPARDFVVTSPPPAAASGGSPFGQGGDPGMSTGTVAPRQTFGSSNPPTPAVRQMAVGQAPAAASGRGNWSTTGGTSIRAAAGDTPEALSRRYGVPAAAIAQANGISANQAFSAGQSVTIPTYSIGGAAGQPQAAASAAASVSSMRPAAPAAPAVPAAPARAATTDLVRQPAEAPRRVEAPVPQSRMAWQSGAQPTAQAPAPAAAPVAPRAAQATRGTHTVTSGETLAGVARRYGVPRDQLAQANGLQAGQALRNGQVLRLPTVQASAPTAATRQAAATSSAPASAAAPAAAPGPATAAAAPAARREQAQRAVAEAQATPAGRQADPQATAAIPSQAAITQQSAPPSAPAAAETASATAEAPARAANAEPQFRWPVRGRVVAGFRSGTNDGIKLSVPQGTPVKAAEDGVVAYAGNELRGYGNLVLVRHSNGYVTAYAHNSTIAVRRGEQVRRGQTIAAAGQTGNVSSPQLHFEIRRGATPVDPMTFLGAN